MSGALDRARLQSSLVLPRIRSGLPYRRDKKTIWCATIRPHENRCDTCFQAKTKTLSFSPVTRLSRWIERKQLTSERLTQIYLKRLEQFDPKLRLRHHAHPRSGAGAAKKADQEIAAGRYRGPLHGIPWGGKRSARYRRHRPPPTEPNLIATVIPKEDAAVTKRLHDAGAVLVAKLSLGALALNDIWFGGQTMNPGCLRKDLQDRVPDPAPQRRRDWLDSPSPARPVAAL